MRLGEPTVCVIGIWHLGAVTSACLAHLGARVIGVEPDAARAAQLAAGVPPLFEPELAPLMRKGIDGGRLRYTADFAAVAEARYVTLAFDTPVDANDDLDLSPIEAAVDALAPHLRPDATLVVQSQVPVGTCEALAERVQARRPGPKPRIACVPENLRLGQAVPRFLNPAMLVIGADDPDVGDDVDALFAAVPAPRVRTTLRTAEMTKHALNAFFATCISFANELASLCDEVGADGVRVAEAMRLDERIGPRALVMPGPPFGGGTLARDLRILQGLGRANAQATPLIDSVLGVNEARKDLAVRRLRSALGELGGRRIAVLGLTYKAGTSTLRRSQALDVVGRLQAEGCTVAAYDPKADLSELGAPPTFELCGSAYDAGAGSDAVVLATEWPEFRDLDLSRLRASMRHGVLIDTKNFLEPAAVTAAGFLYLGIGRGTRPARAETLTA